MSTVATKITFKLSGLFGKSGRYYEFRTPLELVVETDELGNWIHRIDELDIWSVEPTREDSMQSLMQIMDEHYENYGIPKLKFSSAGARKVQKLLQDTIKSAR